MHSWGQKNLDPKQIVGSWELTVFDFDNNPCSFLFDLIPDDSSIIIGLHVGKYSIQNCIADTPFITFKRQTDSSPRTFHLFITSDAEDSQSPRIRVQVAFTVEKCITALMSVSLMEKSGQKPMLFAKRIHRLTHTPADQVKSV